MTEIKANIPDLDIVLTPITDHQKNPSLAQLRLDTPSQPGVTRKRRRKLAHGLSVPPDSDTD
jgi:hypothetical protein